MWQSFFKRTKTSVNNDKGLQFINFKNVVGRDLKETCSLKNDNNDKSFSKNDSDLTNLKSSWGLVRSGSTLYERLSFLRIASLSFKLKLLCTYF